MAALTGANRSSMLQDVEAGRPTEIDAISGAVAHEADRHGVEAPLNRAMTVLVSSLAKP
jgi:2-dehydropantoate 2-reductase